jgi:hypothetical protein
VEAVFRPEIVQIFSDDSGRFLPENTGGSQESTGKNLNNFWPEYRFHVPAISGVFLQDPAGTGGRNLRPGHFSQQHFMLLFNAPLASL